MSQQTQLFKPTAKGLSDYLEKAKSTIALALPKHLNPDRMCRLAVTCFSTTPKLRECDPQSILASIIIASQLGLEPGVAGQGYLIPYKKTCTFVPGWQGLVGLLNNTGRATAWTGAVFDGDEFDFALGSNPHLIHRPGVNYGDPPKMTWVYACGKVNGSEQVVMEAWPMARVWKHRDRFNKVGRMHYSFDHPEMYARKVLLLQVLKYMPRSIELQDALTVANANEEGRQVKVEEGIIVDVPNDPESVPNARIEGGESPPNAERGALIQRLTQELGGAGLDWQTVATEAETGGLFIDATAPIEEQTTDGLQDVLAALPAIIAAITKGGSK